MFDNLKVKQENGQVLFDAEDAAIGLGIIDTSKGNIKVRWARVNKYLGSATCGAEVKVGNYISIPTSGDKIKSGDFITEPQFYKLAIKANNETAEKFQDWVTEEVLPSIRKNGAYLTSKKIEEVLLNPDTIIKLATNLKQERQNNAVLSQQVNELKPKADYTDIVLANKALITISIIAKDYGMSAVTMNQLLKTLGVQYKQGKTWLLYAKHQTKGWTQSKTTPVTHKNGVTILEVTTKWTQKGHLGLYELLKSQNIMPLIEQ